MMNAEGSLTKVNEPRLCALVLLSIVLWIVASNKAREESGTNCYVQQECIRKKIHRL